MKKRKTARAATATLKELYFINVDNKVRWERDRRNDIYIDQDGSLVAKPGHVATPGSPRTPDPNAPYYIAAYYPHLVSKNDPNCVHE